jgi:type III secretion system low calcium response chaperone LcrH/SycD
MMMDQSSMDALAEACALLERLSQGQTLGPLLGMPRESQEQLYLLAYRFYGQAKYEEAEPMFRFLVMANHLDRRFSLGCGACAHMLRRHADAVAYYGLASLLDLTDPEPLAYMAEHLMFLGERTQARRLLDQGLAQVRQHERHREHGARLTALLSLLDSAESAMPSTSASSPLSAIASEPTP